jgi:hypothetical protein
MTNIDELSIKYTLEEHNLSIFQTNHDIYQVHIHIIVDLWSKFNCFYNFDISFINYPKMYYLGINHRTIH